ncbi:MULTISPECIES: hypothetical protein [Saliphagus]|uniref:Uncharacterized protein n=1 Tax=Saliphagus infecundisoli TaxID=1849069 RepID=A0ABD5QB90_9EURY|nr:MULTISPECIES: hypothetical protein [Saliphagus]
MPYDEIESTSTAITRPMCGVFRGPCPRLPPSYIDSPPDEFPSEDRDDPSLRLWFIDEDDETGRIGDDLELEYDGEFESEIETAIDGADAGPDPIDFDCFSVRLYTEIGLRRLVHVRS